MRWKARCLVALAGGVLAFTAQASELPAAAREALQRAHIPVSALSVVVQQAGSGRSLLALNERTAVNPASLIKLLTTYAALDQLGPSWTWGTQVYFGGPLLESARDGVLDGPLIIRGSGDPKIVIERLWLLLRRVQQLGVNEIRGDIVLDRSAFAPADAAPADFDGDPTRPYNVQPDALLLNFKSVIHTLVPDPARGVAKVLSEPDLGAGRPERSVPLSTGACDDWRGALKAVPSENGYRFTGSYALACGERAWPLADPSPRSYNARLITALWRELGGRLTGSVRDGAVPVSAKLVFEQRSPPLAETVRDINKFSNNVMAQQLALSLALRRQPAVAASADGARETLRRWVVERLGEPPPELVIDNGSGLSRQNRVTAQWLAQLLQHAYASPVMPELMSSLPVTGLDGTLRRSRAASGRAHLKTGSLRDVTGVAGYLLADSGQRYVLVAIVNHPNANQARPAIEEIVQWAMREAEPAPEATPTPSRVPAPHNPKARSRP